MALDLKGTIVDKALAEPGAGSSLATSSMPTVNYAQHASPGLSMPRTTGRIRRNLTPTGDGLEHRELLSTIAVSKQTVVITGTAQNDSVSLAFNRKGTTITLEDGTTQTVKAKTIVVDLGAGNDSFISSGSGNANVQVITGPGKDIAQVNHKGGSTTLVSDPKNDTFLANGKSLTGTVQAQVVRGKRAPKAPIANRNIKVVYTAEPAIVEAPQNPVVTPPPTVTPPTTTPPVKTEPPVTTPPVTTPPVTTPPVTTPPVSNPPVTTNPPTTEPPVTTTPPTTTPPSNEPPVNNPPTNNPPTENPPTGNPPTGNPPTENPPVTALPTIDVQQELVRFVELVNNFRAQNNLGALAVNVKLMAAAQLQADQMVQFNKFEHVIEEAPLRRPKDRLAAAGYVASAYQENLGCDVDAAKTMTQFLNSTSGHREAMLIQANNIGVAMQYNPVTNERWWVLLVADKY